MPNYYYVKSGGTATGTAGKYSTAKTGSWSTAFSDTTQYYSNIYTALSQSAATQGDIIIVSNLHDYINSTAAFTLDGGYSIEINCVDNENVQLLSTGAREIYSNNLSNVSFSKVSYVYGMKFEFYGKWQNTITTSTVYENCYFKFIGNNIGTVLNHMLGNSSSSADANIFYTDCTFEFDTSTNWKFPGYFSPYTSFHIFSNCIFKAPYNVSYPLISNQDDLSGDNSARIYFYSCDFTQAYRSIFDGGTNLRQPILIRQFIIKDCSFSPYSKLELPTNAAFSVPNVISNSSNLNSEDYLTLFYTYGKISVNFDIYRNIGSNLKFEYDKNLNLFQKLNPFSIKVEMYSTANTSEFKGIRFKLVDFIRDFSSLQTLTLYVAQDLSNLDFLTNAQLSLDVIYPDDITSKANFISNMCKPLDNIITYPLGGPEWIGFTDNAAIRQKISISTTELGKEGLCSVWVNIFVPNKTIYICPKVTIT
jgi:hypothetical protein